MILLETRGPHLVDEWQIYQIVEWEGEAMPHAVLFPGIPAEEIRRASPEGDDGRLTETGMIVSTTQLFLLRNGGRAILVEAGSGNGKTRPNEPYWDHQNLPYMETLGALDVAPEDVEYLFLSHMHPDHVGLATTERGGRWQPTFPNAKYVFDPREWAYWNGVGGGIPFIEDSIRPLVDAGCVRFAHEGERIGPFRIHPAPGHTPGHLLLEMQGRNLWFLGDLLHHPAQAGRPDFSASAWDVDAELARTQRRRFFKRFADTGAALLAAHLGGPFRLEEISSGRYLVRNLEPDAEKCLPCAAAGRE